MIINPELEAAREAARILFLPSALEVNSFAHGQAELIKFAIPAGNILDGLQIAELRGKIETNILVCGVERDGEVLFLLVILYYSREMLFLLLLPAKLQENSFLISDLRQSR